MIFDWLKRNKKPQISGVEIRVYEADCEQTATEFFRLQIENANLNRQLQQCENNFRVAVDLEVALKTSELVEEAQKLRLRI